MARTQKQVLNLVTALTGAVDEPTFNPLACDQLALIKAINHYNQYYTSEDSKRWALEYLEDRLPEIHSQLKQLGDKWFGTLGYVARCIQLGYTPTEQETATLERELKDLVKRVEPPKEPTKRIQQPVDMFAANAFQDAVEELMAGKKIDVPLLGVDKRAHTIIKRQAEMMVSDLTEPQEYTTEDGEELSEIPARKNSALLKFLTTVLENIGATRQKIQATRPVRQKKVIPSKQVAKLKHTTEDTTYGLKGVSAVKLIGSKQAIFWDAAKRLVIYVKAESDRGLTVDGTTVKGFDPKSCVAKKVRKPEDFVKAIEGQTTVGVREVIKKLSTMDIGWGGRTNEKMLILKA